MKLYEDGYSKCSCFWGRRPGKLIEAAAKLLKQNTTLVLDLGCGDGKNAEYLSREGMKVVALDVSFLAINNFRRNWPNTKVHLANADMNHLPLKPTKFDLIVSSGSLHCLKSEHQIYKVVETIKSLTKKGGIIVITAFNDRGHDFSGHYHGFSPTLISHEEYLSLFQDWKIIESLDETLLDLHPHNNIQHFHSVTKILAEKI